MERGDVRGAEVENSVGGLDGCIGVLVTSGGCEDGSPRRFGKRIDGEPVFAPALDGVPILLLVGDSE